MGVLPFTKAAAEEGGRPPEQRSVLAYSNAHDPGCTIREALTKVQEQQDERPRERAQDRDRKQDTLLRRPKRGCDEGDRDGGASAGDPPGVAIPEWRASGGHGTNCESCGPEGAAQFHTLNVKTPICRTPPTMAYKVTVRKQPALRRPGLRGRIRYHPQPVASTGRAGQKGGRVRLRRRHSTASWSAPAPLAAGPATYSPDCASCGDVQAIKSATTVAHAMSAFQAADDSCGSQKVADGPKGLRCCLA